MRSSVGKVAQVSAPLHIYMVAGSYWRPTLRAGGLRVDPRALGPAIVTQMMTSKPGAAAYPPFPGERPDAEQVLKWIDEVTPLFSADESALVVGIEPRSLLVYAHKSIPLVIVAAPAGTVGGFQPKDVENRD